MLLFIITTSIFFIILIFLVHYLVLFFKDILTVPKTKDLTKITPQKYKEIFTIINNESNDKKNNTPYKKISVNEAQNEYHYFNKEQTTSEDKEELKTFLKSMTIQQY